MGFALPDRFIWDFWTIEHGGLCWLYALTAPRHHDPDTRHNAARVDLMTSRDLMSWDYRGPVLEPGSTGAWDDLAIWTGSVAACPDGGFAMLYTGRCRAEEGRVQRIGLARSDDLITWRKRSQPVIEADPKLCRLKGARGSTNWRDPWLEWDSGRTLWRAWITAQHPDGPVETSGTIALAESPDLVSWTVRPPVIADRLCEHLEVPQLLAGGHGMLVNTYGHFVPENSSLPRKCMSLLFRDEGSGFEFDRIVESWPSDARYILKQVRPGVGLCWLGEQSNGRFLGEISDPFDFDPLGASRTGERLRG